MKPLNVTTTTDMVADWKLVGAGGGVEQTKLFFTLCPLDFNNVHQPNAEKCDSFAKTKWMVITGIVIITVFYVVQRKRVYSKR
jgi:hypothetical protein